MKKLWAICVAFVIVVVVAMTVFADSSATYKEYKVLLDDGIALKFVFEGLNKGEERTIKLESDVYEETVRVVADENGEVYAIYNDLTPAMFDMEVTATLVEDNISVTRSVKQYCTAALGDMSFSNEALTLVADLVNYAVAAQTYLNPENSTATGLSSLQQNIASVVPIKIKNYLKTGDQTGKALQWDTAAPILGESVAYRFRFYAAEGEELPTGLNFTVTLTGKTYNIVGYDEDATGCYVDFTSLTPANLMEDVTIVAKNANGEEISISRTISLDRYTSAVRSDPAIEENRYEELCALLNATLAYAKGAEKYVQSGKQLAAEELRDINTGKLTDFDYYRLSCISITNYDGSAYNGAFAEAMYNIAGLSVKSVGLKNKDVAAVYESMIAGILVEGSLGGSSEAEYPFLAQKDFEIGDLLYAKVPISGDNNEDITYSYWTALYLGEGRFLLETLDQSDMEISYTDLKNYLLTGGAIEDKNDDDEDDQVATVSPANYYFVLRPNQAAPKTLTEAKKNITRAEMENALKETLWAYYTKGTWAQYESTTFNAISYTHGGYSPLGTHMNTLEDATEDTTLYTVCSNYAWSAYYEALGFPLFGYCLNPGSAYLWIMADEVPADADGDMLCVMRWHNYSCDHTSQDGDRDEDDEDNNHSSIQHSKDICCGYGNTVAKDGIPAFDLKTAYDELYDYFWKYETNLRPGDIIRLPGHVVVYAGDGWILEAGGSKYNKEYGYDGVETNGVIHATKLKDYFFPENGNTSFRLAKFYSGSYAETTISERNLAGICVLRPLDLLTTDDGDDDPSNDLLNLNYYHAAVEYKTDTGYETLTWQLEQDTVELAHTGYTIQPDTYTRMMFPMMNINRTVNIGAYGTAVKGGTITYTVEIRNQSNDAKYIQTRGDGYAGEDYIGLPIMETIPANVEFVSATDGYTIDENGVLRWNIDVSAGETVQVSYTVRVTGEMGAEIVNDGGMVGYIPSNTLVNTIGGQKISDEAQAKLLAFYKAGRKEWNSNDGYKISASTSQDGSVFAEQIYNVMGLSLDLPDLEDLLQMLFDREEIKISKGTWVGYRKAASSWMLTLKDQTEDPSNQIWRDMVINGSYFGGNYVWTNNLDEETRRVSIPRTEDLMPGDFIICMNVSNVSYEAYAYKIPDWKVLIYLGEDKYASLTSDGVLSACDGPRELVGSIVYDVFIGLRPSQAYENVNQNIASGTLADLTDADEAWQAGKPSTIVLNKEYKSNFESMVMKNVDKDSYLEINGANITPGLPMIGEVYALAGVNISNNVVSKVSYKALTYLLFNGVTSDNAFGREYHRLDQPVYGYESIYNMLMFYDGRAYVDKNALTSMNDLLVGDVIVLGSAAGKAEQVLIYQSGGRFMTSTDSPIGGFYMSEWLELKTFANTEELLAYLNGFVHNKKNEIIRGGVYWDGYLVLRPSRGFYDINSNVARDLKECMLTKEEMAALSRLTATTISDNTYNGFIKWAYGKAMIDVGEIFAIKKDGEIGDNLYYYQLFNDSCVLKITGNDFQKMLVDKSWGGTKFDGKGKTSYQLSLNDFQVGDILIGRYYSDGNKYRAAIYLGDNRFLVRFGKTVRIIVCESASDIYDAQEWEYYFVLRPQTLAEVTIDKIELPPMPA